VTRFRSELGSLTLLVLTTLAGGVTTTPSRAGDDADDPPAATPSATEQGKALLAEGDALADKGDTAEALLRYKAAYEKILPGMRKVPFKFEVKRDVTARDKLRDYLVKDFEQDMTPEEFRGMELGLKALGFIPRDMDFKDVMLKVLTEEIAAFYDPRTKTMHLIEEQKDKKPGLLELLMGRTGGFDKEENQTVIAHELTHALADQNFDLEALHRSVKGDDDMDLALSALIEGEATLTMMSAQMKDWDGAMMKAMPSADLGQTMDMVGPFLPMFGGGALRTAPAIVRDSMLFSYLRGLVFCSRLINDGDWKAIDEAYASPPLSTEQILHPEKYRAEPDPPTDFELGTVAVPGWTEAGRNVVGELQLSTLLGGRGAGKKAAAGWDGDRFIVFSGPDEALALAWITTWDSEQDAREFARAYARVQSKKIGEAAAPIGDEFPDDLVRTSKAGATFEIVRKGVDVAVVEGFAADRAAAVREALFSARKMPKTIRAAEARDATRPTPAVPSR
jgi:hypothetical protein